MAARYIIAACLHITDKNSKPDKVPGQLLWLGVIEEILQVAQRLVLLQALGLAKVDFRNTDPKGPKP